jgi:type IV fimbrial biogenesis protein FimT
MLDIQEGRPVLKTHVPQRGFNIIEILVSLAVLGVLMALGAPAFSGWLQNQQVRAASEAILNGMQVARSEAIGRNLAVQLVLVPDLTGWTVCEATVNPCDWAVTAAPSVIQSRAHEEGTSSARILTAPDGAVAVTFSPLGSRVANFDASPILDRVNISNPAGGDCQAIGGPMRCLAVVVSGGGSIRMCDPTPGIAAPDPRACP